MRTRDLHARLQRYIIAACPRTLYADKWNRRPNDMYILFYIRYVRATEQPTASGQSREVYAPALCNMYDTAAVLVIDVRPPNRIFRFRYCHFDDCDWNNKFLSEISPPPSVRGTTTPSKDCAYYISILF